MPDRAYRALGRGPEGGSKLGDSRRLGHVGVGAPVEGGRDGGRVMPERADHETGPRRHPPERIDGVEADLERHLDLDDDDIGAVPAHELDGRLPAVRLGDLRRLEGLLQQLADHAAPPGAGVDGEDAYVIQVRLGVYSLILLHAPTFLGHPIDWMHNRGLEQRHFPD